ncbi:MULTISPECIES: hypothetical protein [Acidiphilium]|uniref:hypothetical protein n=1 Tax=Acidiphilium TaxID=522 RepID=UPI00258760AE|nr:MULTISPECIES: hypothetical protein [Acidiphilium]HQT85038.1 hypothetical protein [Acidiphilium rubrum]
MAWIRQAAMVAFITVLPALILVPGAAQAQLAVHPIVPPSQHGVRMVPPSCRSTVRYFGKGSLTADYPLEHVAGQYPWMVPPHALVRLIGHTGPMWGGAFFQSQRWQMVRQLGAGACRFLSRRRPVMHMTVTDRHGRRVGLIIALLRGDGEETTP